MKLNNPAISILINRDSTTIELHDRDSNMMFAQITLTPEQLSSALSRLGMTNCEIKLNGLSNVGKTMEHKQMELPYPMEVDRYGNPDIEKQLAAYFDAHCTDGWKCWDNFSSQGTYFVKDGMDMVRASIRRWV